MERRLEKEVEKFTTLLNTDSKLVTDSIERIVLSSNNGGVDTLFIAEDVQKWGFFNEDDNSLEVNNKEDIGQVDLMDKAAMLTLSSGGTVHVLQRDKMPSGKTIAAVLRF
jgi:peptide subunit release factor 1 (eRF1)